MKKLVSTKKIPVSSPASSQRSAVNVSSPKIGRLDSTTNSKESLERGRPDKIEKRKTTGNKRILERPGLLPTQSSQYEGGGEKQQTQSQPPPVIRLQNQRVLDSEEEKKDE